jgi:transposase
MNTKKFRSFSRAHDEQVLAMLKARAAGVSIRAIAREFGVGVSSVQTPTNSVRISDLLESGEDSSQVDRHYWRG